jgi:hypothetical protein
MTRKASSVAMVAAALLTQACTGGTMAVAPSAPAAAGAPSDPSYGVYGYDSYFKVESQPDERHGKPLVSGYVGNQWGFPVRNVRLRVEALDAAGNVTATSIGYVNGTVIPGSRVYFEVPVPAKAPGYRVRLLSFDPVQGHGP